MVILNTLTPGFCHSNLTREIPFPLSWIVKCTKAIFARTTEVGSRTLVAASVAGEESHGQYMVDCNIKKPGPWVTSTEGIETGRRVYDELLDILDEIQPGIKGNI
jgi:retinol dehydrogenase-12